MILNKKPISIIFSINFQINWGGKWQKKLILSCDQARLKKSKWRRFCTLQYILMLERRNITVDKVAGLKVVDMIIDHKEFKTGFKTSATPEKTFLRNRYFFHSPAVL